MEDIGGPTLVVEECNAEPSAGEDPADERGSARRHRAERKARHSASARRGAHHLAARFRASRKRSHTAVAKFFLPHKRARKDAFIPPTKFLLGGNISDPLNLNSLQDEDVNRAMNAFTPESSPLPTPPRHKAKVDVIIPPDVRDPLNLLHALSDDEYEKRLEQRSTRRPRKRVKPRPRTIDTALPTAPASPPPEPASAPHSDTPRKRSASESDTTTKAKDGKKPRRIDSMDKIVSPVVPQPGAWMRARPPARERTQPPPPRVPAPPRPIFNPKNERYQYGNYDRYYGYRHCAGVPDVRLEVLQQYRHVFLNKDVLDVGCNVGYMSIAAARELGARSVTGIDIDPALVARARRNLQALVSVPAEGAGAGAACERCPGVCVCGARGSGKRGKRRKKQRRTAPATAPAHLYFPASFSALYGSLAPPPPSPPHDAAQPHFPHNVTFKQGNYVAREEAGEPAQYDVVLCLSTTKWLHLNFGDAGLKLAFRRMFAELRPGGKLVLEPQSWASYTRRRRLTEQIYNNYNSIELLPSKFREYLLSPEVGFSRCCVMGVPRHRSKGFRRPLHLYVKGDFTPSKAQWSDAYAPPSSQHRPDAAPPRRTVYAPCAPRTPSCDAAAPYSPAPHLSPFCAPHPPAASTSPFLEPSPAHAHTPCHPALGAAHKYALHSPRSPLSPTHHRD